MGSPPNRYGIHFKPWPLANFLSALLGLVILFILERVLPPGYLTYSSLLGASMASMMLSYMSYCGYSVWTSPPRVKFNLIAAFIAIAIVFSALASFLLKG